MVDGGVEDETSNTVHAIFWSTALNVLEHARGTTYPDMAWEPKQVFGALATAYARARP